MKCFCCLLLLLILSATHSNGQLLDTTGGEETATGKKRQKNIFDVKTSSNISTTISYIDLPFISNRDSVQRWFYRTEIRNELIIADMPINFGYAYSNNLLGNVYGNGFSVSFDYERYKMILLSKYRQMLADSIRVITEELNKRADSLENAKRLWNYLEGEVGSWELHEDSLYISVRDDLTKERDEIISRIEMLNKKMKVFEGYDRNKVLVIRKKLALMNEKLKQLNGKVSLLRQFHLGTEIDFLKLRKQLSDLGRSDSIARVRLSEYSKKTASQGKGKVTELLNTNNYKHAAVLKYSKYLRSFNIGRSVLGWTELTSRSYLINGIQISVGTEGGGVEIVYGRAQNLEFTQVLRLQDIYTVPRLNLGEFSILGVALKRGSAKNNIGVRYIDFLKNGDHSAPVEPSSLVLARNRILSIDFHFSDKLNRAKFFGEIAMSLSEGSPGLRLVGNERFSSRVARQIFGEKAANSGVSDLALDFGVRGRILKKYLSYALNYKNIGTHYQSMGNAFLLNGSTQYELTFSAKVRSSLELKFFGRNQYQYNEWYGFKAVNIKQMGGTLIWRPDDMPYIIASVFPYLRTVDINSYKYLGMSIVAGYNRKFKGRKFSVTGSFLKNSSIYQPFADTLIQGVSDVFSTAFSLELRSGFFIGSRIVRQYWDVDAVSYNIESNAGIRSGNGLRFEVGTSYYREHPIWRGAAYRISGLLRIKNNLSLVIRAERMQSQILPDEELKRFTTTMKLSF